MNKAPSIDAQIESVKAAQRALNGGVKPNSSEREYLAPQLDAALVTLGLVQQYAKEFREAIVAARQKRESGND